MGATGDVEQPRGPGGAERGGPEPGDAGAAGQLVPKNPWNLMIKHRQVQRRGRRSQMTTSFTDPSISMDLLRAVLQPSINEEIQTVLNKYMKCLEPSWEEAHIVATRERKRLRRKGTVSWRSLHVPVRNGAPGSIGLAGAPSCSREQVLKILKIPVSKVKVCPQWL